MGERDAEFSSAYPIEPLETGRHDKSASPVQCCGVYVGRSVLPGTRELVRGLGKCYAEIPRCESREAHVVCFASTSGERHIKELMIEN